MNCKAHWWECPTPEGKTVECVCKYCGEKKIMRTSWINDLRDNMTAATINAKVKHSPDNPIDWILEDSRHGKRK